MKRLLPALLLCLVTIPILAALIVGILWLRAALPHAPAPAETPALRPPDYAPRTGAIPWQRDPGALPRIAAGPAWFPWEKMPKGARSTNAWVPPPPAFPRAPISPAEIAAVTKDLAATDPAPAIARVEHFVHINPLVAGEQLRRNAPWANALVAAGRFDTLDRLTDALILPLAYNTAMLDALLNQRTRTAMDEKRPDVALERARQWFAIATLYSTSTAIRAAQEAIAAQNVPTPKPALRAFRASFTETVPFRASAASQPTPSPLRLDPSAPDAAPFLAAARQLNAEDYASLTARGNLYLLAGRPDLAKPVFRRAYTMATDPELPAAVENLARCIKADTGTLAAANAFIQEPHP